MTEHIVGSIHDLSPGSHRVIRVGTLEIGIFNVQGALYALPNVCTHQFGPLCEGTVNGTSACNAQTGWRYAWMREGEIVTCPWHGLEFDIITGQCLAQPALRLRQYRITVEDGRIKLMV